MEWSIAHNQECILIMANYGKFFFRCRFSLLAKHTCLKNWKATAMNFTPKNRRKLLFSSDDVAAPENKFARIKTYQCWLNCSDSWLVANRIQMIMTNVVISTTTVNCTSVIFIVVGGFCHCRCWCWRWWWWCYCCCWLCWFSFQTKIWCFG